MGGSASGAIDEGATRDGTSGGHILCVFWNTGTDRKEMQGKHLPPMCVCVYVCVCDTDGVGMGCHTCLRPYHPTNAVPLHALRSLSRRPILPTHTTLSAGSSQALITRKSITEPNSLNGLVLAAPKSSTGHYHLQFLLTEVS